MKNLIIALLIIVMGLVFYNNRQKVDGYQEITPADAKIALEQEKDTILLDVRTKEEYQEKHIEGSLLIPLNELEKEVEKVIPNKKDKVIVYCRSGNRSQTAVNMLIKMGYKNVYDLGGINNWPY